MALKAVDKHHRLILLGLFGWRLFNALITRTFFQADEFWQALEPAHFKAFGYGGLTWEWNNGLRSYAFPFLLEIAYRLARLVSKGCQYHWGEDRGDKVEYYCVIIFPKVMMAFIAALGELYTILFVKKLYLLTFDKTDDKKPHDDWNVEKITIILSVTNFFNCFLITRTFINSFEMSLTSAALYYWDWTGGDEVFTTNFTKSLCIAVFACLQRPTNGLIWIIFGSRLIWNLFVKSQYGKVLRLIGKVAFWFALVCSINMIIDYHFYNENIFPPLNFLRFNVLSPLSTFYGANQWHFHITQSLPLILNYTIPLFCLGLTYGRHSDVLTQIKIVIGFNLIAYSMLSHKEFRFVYPLQPLLVLISTFGALKLQENNVLKHCFLLLAPLGSIIAAFLLCWYHESGTIAVMKYLHDRPVVDSIGFIMPCHSTPWQSYLHRNDIKSLWAITCDPPLHLMGDPDASAKLPYYMDESDFLYDDISGFIERNFPLLDINSSKRHTYQYEWPRLLVVFQHLENAYIKEHLKDNAYVEETRFFNSLVHWDSRREGDVIVYRKL
ncbi:hypothetical protein ZYGR_0A03140 [Zygosaccharomyces rouxii]|uniref:Mannosyltransferase n=2 Tax=Zygosaccharomyces rouxii TaxID=4956 RepID=C5DPY4_ZYGRC|nr:uncharacterized protein ZYRO0A07128g [Zygosaccharomyces rouxii]KAH9198734.1 Alg9-like mannosyltransferase family-domain-containing protein [Zygosaccharomyces rouxii]GAV46719.1 hypothetical protein ZYGR_0A03140 [Zygosaccharomyces rouxii]CAR25745.1 ZYRO0A07128p [Zygosaccharomyces rouxii]